MVVTMMCCVISKLPERLQGMCVMHGEEYRLKLGELSKDQLMKVIGFLSTLDR